MRRMNPAFAAVLCALIPIPRSPEVFRKVLRADIEKWGRVIKTSGAKPE